MMPAQQLTLLQWEDPNYDATKDFEEQRARKKADREAQEEQRKLNQVDWKEINEFGKSNKYYGCMCIQVASWKVDDRPCLDEHTEMKYQYEGHDGAMQDGGMSGGAGYGSLREMDKAIQNFFRSCGHYNIQGRLFFSKAAEDLIDMWIEEGNNYYVSEKDVSTLDEVLKRVRHDTSIDDGLWDYLEWHAIRELGYEKGVELLVSEYAAWRRRVMQYCVADISRWQDMWKEHGPLDFYIERVLHDVEEHNFHASRLGEPELEEPPFISRWKQELQELIEKRWLKAEKEQKELADKKKKEREEKRAARKKEDEDKKASRREELLKKYGTPFTDSMKAAEKADDGRSIITEYTVAFGKIEIEAGLFPTIGTDGSGVAYRGFSTLSKTELKKAIKRVLERDATMGERLEALVEDIHLSEEYWRKLYAKEISDLMESVHCKDAKTKKVMK